MKQIDPEYPLELQVLLGEWLTYTAINRYNWEMSYNGDIQSGLSDEEMFERCPLHSGAHRLFEIASQYFLTDLQIVTTRRTEFGGLVDYANCRYRDIPDVIRNRIERVRGPVPFIQIAEYLGYLGGSEKDRFSAEKKCKPIISKLVDAGFCTDNGENYSWTAKMRPFLESYNIWNKGYTPSVLKPMEEIVYLNSKNVPFSIYEEASTSEEKEKRLEKLYSEGMPRPPAKPQPEIVFRWFGP